MNPLISVLGRVKIVEKRKEVVRTVRSSSKKKIKTLAPEQRIRLMEEQGLLQRATRRRFPSGAPIAIKGRPIAETVFDEREMTSDPKERDLSPTFLRELRRRNADADDPTRYAVFSDLMERPRWRLWLDVSDGVYGMSIEQATLFKRKQAAQAIAKACSSGRKTCLSVAKITTKNGKRRIIRIEK